MTAGCLSLPPRVLSLGAQGHRDRSRDRGGERRRWSMPPSRGGSDFREGGSDLVAGVHQLARGEPVATAALERGLVGEREPAQPEASRAGHELLGASAPDPACALARHGRSYLHGSVCRPLDVGTGLPWSPSGRSDQAGYDKSGEKSSPGIEADVEWHRGGHRCRAFPRVSSPPGLPQQSTPRLRRSQASRSRGRGAPEARISSVHFGIAASTAPRRPAGLARGAALVAGVPLPAPRGGRPAWLFRGRWSRLRGVPLPPLERRAGREEKWAGGVGSADGGGVADGSGTSERVRPSRIGPRHDGRPARGGRGEKTGAGRGAGRGSQRLCDASRRRPCAAHPAPGCRAL